VGLLLVMRGAIRCACALALLLVAHTAYAQADPTRAGAFEYPAGSGCMLVPLPGTPNVFTVDTIYPPDTGEACGFRTWTPAINILRGYANAGEGHSLNGDYLSGDELPGYLLVAAEECGDNLGFTCGRFSVLVPSQRSGQYWNAATAAAHSLQRSRPPQLSAKASSGSWDFVGEEPQPVSDACLLTLPLPVDPCWGTGFVNYSQPQRPRSMRPPRSPGRSETPGEPGEPCNEWFAAVELESIPIA
jgi:hypothetical protein